jgi:2-keto-4-pentenoate hydratase
MPSAYESCAELLRKAYKTGPVPPLRAYLEPGDAVGAYEIQLLNTQHWVAAGRRITGRKVGLTAKAVQAQLGVSQPDFGVLFADMALPDGGTLLASTVLQPKAEAEIAFVLHAALPGPDITRAQVEAAIAYALPAIEIVDSRIADWKISFADTVADNGSSAFYVLGEARKPLAGLDLWSCGMVLEVNGAVASLGAGAACLGHPVNALTWLAQTLAASGDPLQAGDVVLSGALGPMVTLSPGDQVRASIGGLGGVSFTYTEDRA